ncbi:TetR/AcrR family transcriptional regulator [Nocardioides sp. WS12]|uniref:TetR/AcrR family transcriptional regulator n=1 Tax=Nocardioides sp. WS12 TaxID=2486272 RepID=UPI0015FE10A9|nr:TetR/AcrR family transcriptional regulator [Nocardioides sp. WS12]
MARIAGLDVPGIVKAALAIADRDGLDKLTMRRLSAELGVTPMATYHHVSGKEELLDLVIDESIGQLGFAESGDPEAVIVDWFLRLHDLLIEHPAIGQASAGRQIVGPQATQVGITLSRMAEGVCHDLDRAAQMVVAGFWLTLGSGLHRASRHPGGYGAEDQAVGSVDDERELLGRVLAAAGQDDQFSRSLALLIRSHLHP